MLERPRSFYVLSKDPNYRFEVLEGGASIRFWTYDPLLRTWTSCDQIPTCNSERTFNGPQSTFYFFMPNGSGHYFDGSYYSSFAAKPCLWCPDSYINEGAK